MIDTQKFSLDKSLSLIMIRVSKKCTAKCIMCGFWKSKEQEMPWRNLKKIINEAVELRVKGICFTGGEPTAYTHLHKAIKTIKQRNMNYSIITNGSLLTKAQVKRLMKCPPTEIHVSIDSPHSKLHDEIRGVKGIWKKATTGLKFFNRYPLRPKIIINYVVTNKNFKKIPQMVLLKNKFPFDEINLIQIKGKPELRLNQKQIYLYNYSIVPSILHALNKYNVQLSCENPYIFGQKQKEINASINGKYSKYAYERTNCVLSTKMLFIETNGDVYPCNNTPYKGALFGLGNAFEKKLSDMMNSERTKQVQRLIRIGGYCTTCDPVNQAINKKSCTEIKIKCLTSRGDKIEACN